MDKLGQKPLHRLTRHEALIELRQTRAELKQAQQQIKDILGGLHAIGEVEHAVSHSPTHDVRNTPRPRI